jgi:hypothetical protein
VLCVLYVITAVCPVLFAQSSEQQTEAASAGPIHLVATLTINRTEPDSDGCFEKAKGRQDQWRSAGEIFTNVYNLNPPVISIFTLGVADADHMYVYAPPNVPVDQRQLEKLEYAIQVYARPTLGIRLLGWFDKDYKHHHSGQEFADLTAIFPRKATADLRYAHFEDLRFNGETLRDMDFTGANFVGASLCHLSDLTGFLNFTDADLTGASLVNSNFAHDVFIRANLTAADLTDATFDGSDLAGAIFEPSDLPSVATFAHAKNIEQVSYLRSPEALNKMRKQLEEAGFHDEARRVSYALSEAEDARLLHSCRPPDKQEVQHIVLGMSPMRKPDRMACVTYYTRKLVFEKTNSYGLQRSKPLLLLVYVWALGGILFWIFLQWNWRSGLSIRVSRRSQDGSEHTRIVPLKARYWSAAIKKKRSSSWTQILLFLRDQIRLASAAAFFSLTSVTTLDVREWQPGRWLALLLDRNYSLIGRGWVKRWGGIQALVCLYLLALLVISLFNLPY